MCWLTEKIRSFFQTKKTGQDKKEPTKVIRPVPSHIQEGIEFGYKYPPEIAELIGMEFHRGQDYLAPVGTPCFATKGSIVNVYDDVKYFGLYVVEKVVLENVILYCYFCHLKEALVKIGDQVESGQTIAYTGASGSATRLEGGNMVAHPHLHFEVRKNSRASSAAVDPLGYM